MEIGTSDINSTAVIEDALMGIIMQRNNLVVNTSCNIDCVFCSRKFNPYQTKLFQKDFNLIRAEIGLFTPNKLIHINSAISTLTDGEPFIHPRIWDILALIRSKFPYRGLRNLNDKIKITTNGTLMTGNNLKKLEDLKGIILVHSVNSTAHRRRQAGCRSGGVTSQKGYKFRNNVQPEHCRHAGSGWL